MDLSSPIDLRDVARARIQAAREDITDGFLPEAICALKHAIGDLQTFIAKHSNVEPYPERNALHSLDLKSFPKVSPKSCDP
jgi:hypothetical protein